MKKPTKLKIAKKTVWQVIGRYQGQIEVLDEFDTSLEASKMLAEYRLAYGPAWSIDIKKGVSNE